MTKAYLEPEEIVVMERAATCLRDRLLVRVLSHSGCRITEALNLQVKDIDFSEGTITILHLKARSRLFCPHCKARLGRSHTFCAGCGTKVKEAVVEERQHRRLRTLPVDEGTLQLLEEYVRRGGPVTRDGKQLIFGINRGVRVKLEQHAFTRNNEDYKFIIVASGTCCKRLITHEPHFFGVRDILSSIGITVLLPNQG